MCTLCSDEINSIFQRPCISLFSFIDMNVNWVTTNHEHYCFWFLRFLTFNSKLVGLCGCNVYMVHRLHRSWNQSWHAKWWAENIYSKNIQSSEFIFTLYNWNILFDAAHVINGLYFFQMQEPFGIIMFKYVHKVTFYPSSWYRSNYF